VSQAGPMMGGMPPGAGTAGPGGPMPNAHAMSHLNPAQVQHMFQQQAFSPNCESLLFISPGLGIRALSPRYAFAHTGHRPSIRGPTGSIHGLSTTIPPRCMLIILLNCQMRTIPS
jgi:hypothetical protein